MKTGPGSDKLELLFRPHYVFVFSESQKRYMFQWEFEPVLVTKEAVKKPVWQRPKLAP